MRIFAADSSRLLAVTAAAVLAAAVLTPLVVRAGLGPMPWIMEAARGSMSRVFVRLLEIALFVLLIAYHKKTGLQTRADFGLAGNKNTARAQFLQGAAIGLTAAGALFVLLFLCGARVWTGANMDTKTVGVLVSIVPGALAVALAEEILFRGVLFGKLKKDLRPYAAQIIAAFVFAAAHFLKSDKIIIEQVSAFSGFTLIGEIIRHKFQNPAALLPALAGLFLLGIVLNTAFARTQNIWTACGLHFSLVVAARTAGVFSDTAHITLATGSGTHINGICGWTILVLTAIWLHKSKTARE